MSAVIALISTVIIIAGLALVSVKLMKILNSIDTSIADLTRQVQHNAGIARQVGWDVRLTDAAKSIAFRDSDRRRLADAVMEKLHEGDFDATDTMIDEIAARGEYKSLAEHLRQVAHNYKNASEKERFDQVAKYIEKLCDQHQWTTAAVQADRLLKANPASADAKKIKQSISEKKQMHKRQLLAAWDEAVKKDDTDGCINILKELDLYLTPSEGLALQEAASQVFKNKLHNMGVEFSLAVADKQWAKALSCANEITKQFPNSKMASEIRSKQTILEELAAKES